MKTNSSLGTSSVEPVRRVRWDGLRVVISAGIFALAVSLTSIPPAAWEESVFRAIYNLPYFFEVVLFPLQQAGMVLAVPVAALVLWRLIRDWRPPTGLLVGGIGLGWAVTKILKKLVDRGRPTDLFDDVERGLGAPSSGLGFPSGHAVVAVIIAVVLSPYLKRWQRWALFGLALATCVARVITTAHMPLDVLGGAAYGALIGSVVNLIVGIRPDKATVPLES